jgi:2-polyprenyl-3-methyl-5-hydroxy-6-metoxy-1,4-benzoquinol methylase
MAGKAYSALAPHYDKLINSCDYEQWSQYVFNTLSKYAKGKVGCDLACGSGYFTRFLKGKGFDVYGVDNSEKMLAKANEISFKEKIVVDYQLQDIKKFKSFKSRVLSDQIDGVKKNGMAAFRSHAVFSGFR